MNIYSKLIEIPGKLLCNQCRFPGPFMLAVRKLKDSGHSGAVTKEGKQRLSGNYGSYDAFMEGYALIGCLL